MKTAQYLKSIYESSATQLGKAKAKEYVATTLVNIFYDLEETGEMSAEKIEESLKIESEFCIECAKRDMAS